MCTCLAEQRSSRPHHCQPQWVANNSLWAAAWATTMPFHVVEQMTPPSAFVFVVPVRPSRCSSTCTIQPGSFSGYSRLQHWQFCSVTFSLPLATIGSCNFVILVLDVINLPLCTAHTSASPESIQWYIFQSVVLRSCVTKFLVRNTHLSNSRSNPLGRSYCVKYPYLTWRVPLALAKPHLDVRTYECLQRG